MFLDGLSITISISALGLLLGWLIGASQTPVTGAVIPLVFALIGVAFARFQEKRTGLRQLIDAVGTLDDDLRNTAIEILRRSTSFSHNAVILWGIATIVFVMSLFCGLSAAKNPMYAQSEEMVDPTAFANADVATRSQVEHLRRFLIDKRVQPSDVKAIFLDAVSPSLKSPYVSTETYYATARTSVLVTGEFTGKTVDWVPKPPPEPPK